MTTIQDYLSQLEEVTKVVGDVSKEVTGVTIDSRQVAPGFIFCAVNGANFNAVKFIPNAIKAGAIAIVAEEKVEVPSPVAFIQVANSYHAAARLAMVAQHCPASKMTLWGITGTNGKTTTAFLIRDLWKNAKKNVGMIGTVQYSYGEVIVEADRTTPPAFASQELLAKMVDNGVTDVVLEMSSHALDQQRLGKASFVGAIFTNLSGDHLDYHKNMENYYQCKKLLFTRDLTQGGIAIINTNHDSGKRLAVEIKQERSDVKCLTFGYQTTDDWRITEVHSALAESQFKLVCGDDILNISTPLIGDFNIENVTGAVLLAYEVGIPKTIICDTIKKSMGAPGRLQALVSPKAFAVYIDYAHTDDALENVLKTLNKLKHNRIITLFGCGGDRDKTKRPRMAEVASKLSDITIVTSDNPRTEDPQQIINDILPGIIPSAVKQVIIDRATAIEQTIASAQEGDIILIAGKGHENYQEINGVKHHFDDAEEVRKYL